ncbi:MAG: hypothetical protein RSD57_13475 [Comamonas sp.]
MHTLPRLYFWRCQPGNIKARSAVLNAAYHAFARSHRGLQWLAAMKHVHRAKTYERVSNENASYEARGDFESLFYMIDVRDQLLSGQGNDDHLSLLHSWIGHLLYAAVQRAKQLPRNTIAYQELRQNTLPRICRGRRALINAWRRWVNTKRAGFAGPDLEPFRQGFDEACLLSKHLSRKELRAAFAYADHLAKTKGYKVVIANYRV